MSEPAPAFVHALSLQAGPERVWRGLTEPADTRRYWGLALESDWRTGSPYTVHLDRGGVTIAHPDQVVLVAEPFGRLSYTWHTFTPEWGAAYGFPDEYVATLAAEPRSVVTFEIEEDGPAVTLTMTHDGFGSDSLVRAGISQGWPQILSGLKSVLEADGPD